MNKSKQPWLDWSLIRTLMAQGASIYQDYQAGKYKDYEEYAARLDEAARERVSELEIAAAPSDGDA